MKRQLDLLELLAEIEARPVVVRLPVSVWGRTIWAGDKVRQIAEGIVEEPERADQYWRGAQAIIATELRDLGASEPEILVELEKYRTAVTIEACRRRRQRTIGGAA